MADQLAIYNAALAHLGERRLASLAEPREPARVLADAWEATVTGCLQMAPWSFATRTQEIDAVAAGAGPFAYAIPKPADWLRTVDVALDRALTQPPDGYIEEGGFWHATAAGLFVRFVSSHPEYGFGVARWHQPFADLVALALAARCCRRLTGAADMLGDLIKLREAAAKDALVYEETTAARQYPAPGDSLETRLQAYNDALAHLGRARIPSLTQASETVRALNDQWLGAVLWCLQQAPWQFAARAAVLQPAGDSTSSAYPYAFAKPADWLVTLDIARDAQITVPVFDFAEEARSWFAPVSPLAVRYVSSDPRFGLDLAAWPPSFRDLVALRLAQMSAGRLGDADPDKLLAKVAVARTAAIDIETDRLQRSFPADAAGATVLRIYNDALAYLGRPRLAALTEAHPTMRILTDEWALAVRWALEQGPWTFAIRAIMIGPWSDTVPTFGYRNAFRKPDDWLQTVLVSLDEKFGSGSTNYADETGYWFADAQGLFVRYVSLGANYGTNLPRWSPSFCDLVAVRMAEKAAPRLQLPQGRIGELAARRAEALKRQRATDALNTPPQFPPVGSWVKARRHGRPAWSGERGDGVGGPSLPFTGDTTLGGDSDLPVNSDFVPRISG